MAVQQARIGDVLTRVGRRVTVEASSTYPNVGVLNRNRGLFEKPALRGAETKYKTLHRLAAGDLVYSKLFGWEGAVSLVPDWADGSYVSSEFPTYSLSPDVHPNYMRHVIAWDGFTSQLTTATTGMGQRRQRVNPDQFEAIAIPLPGLPEQQRIAARLDRFASEGAGGDEVREIEQAWRSLVEMLTFREEAEARRIGDFLRPKSGVPVSPSATYNIAGVYSFGRGLLSRGALPGSATKYKTYTTLSSNDLLYSKLGAFEGAVAVVPAHFGGFHVSPEFPVFEVLDGVHPGFLRYCVIAESFVQQLTAATAGVGARQKRVSPGSFLELTIPLPDLNHQAKIAQRLDLATRVLELKRRSAHIRSALLPAARNEAFAQLT